MAFCQKCGSAIAEEASFCGKCGVPVVSASFSLPVAPVPVQVPRRSPLKVLLWAGAGFFALIIMLGLIVAAGGKGSSQASDLAAIEAVRQQDADLAAAMTAESKGLKVNSDEDLDKAGELIKNYVTAARRIDTHFCPRDFAESYYRNITAWSDEADAILAHPHIPATQTEAFVDGFFLGLITGDVSGGTNEINAWYDQVKEKEAELKRTQDEVNALAVRYGAR
jgi:hypothetical protein